VVTLMCRGGEAQGGVRACLATPALTGLPMFAAPHTLWLPSAHPQALVGQPKEQRWRPTFAQPAKSALVVEVAISGATTLTATCT